MTRDIERIREAKQSVGGRWQHQTGADTGGDQQLEQAHQAGERTCAEHDIVDVPLEACLRQCRCVSKINNFIIFTFLGHRLRQLTIGQLGHQRMLADSIYLHQAIATKDGYQDTIGGGLDGAADHIERRPITNTTKFGQVKYLTLSGGGRLARPRCIGARNRVRWTKTLLQVSQVSFPGATRRNEDDRLEAFDGLVQLCWWQTNFR